MARRGAVVYERVALLSSKKLSDVGHSDLQLKSAGHTIERLHPLTFKFLAVLVKVNEPGSHNQPSGIQQRVRRTYDRWLYGKSSRAVCPRCGLRRDRFPDPSHARFRSLRRIAGPSRGLSIRG